MGEALKDLEQLIRKHPDALDNPQKFRGYLSDLYPGETARVAILTTIFSCGIAREIKAKGMDSIAMSSYVARMEHEFGYSPQITSECLQIWLDLSKIVIEKQEDNPVIDPIETQSSYTRLRRLASKRRTNKKNYSVLDYSSYYSFLSELKMFDSKVIYLYHKSFGVGRVVFVSKDYITVRFDTVGDKTFKFPDSINVRLFKTE